MREETDQAALRTKRAARLVREAFEEDPLFDKWLREWIGGCSMDNLARAAPEHHADALADLGGNEVVSSVFSTVSRTAPTGEASRALLRAFNTVISKG